MPDETDAETRPTGFIQNWLAPLIERRQAVRAFRRDGYVVLRGVVEPERIDAFWRRVEHHVETTPELLFSRAGKLLRNDELDPGDTARRRLRVTNIETVEPSAAELFLHPAIARFLKALYGKAPTAIQTLTYKYSSEQGAHSDRYLVSPRAVGAEYDRDTLAASWIACEDADPENGALIIYPGSHTLPKKRLRDDFDGDYAAYRAYLEALCAENGIAPKTFMAKKGDVLFWDGDFVHAGGPILNPERTRESLVTHYCRLPDRAESLHPERRRVFCEGGSYFA
jgi:ectoine hydroxylase-related dioxygenase (phytanoyl-CoA dioxygenase family)